MSPSHPGVFGELKSAPRPRAKLFASAGQDRNCTVLEVEPQGELNDAPTVRGFENHAECAGPIREIGIGIAESDAVENVEHVGPKLKRGPFRDVRVFDNSKVLVAVARTAGMRQETRRVSGAQWKGIDR